MLSYPKNQDSEYPLNRTPNRIYKENIGNQHTISANRVFGSEMRNQANKLNLNGFEVQNGGVLSERRILNQEVFDRSVQAQNELRGSQIKYQSLNQGGNVYYSPISSSRNVKGQNLGQNGQIIRKNYVVAPQVQTQDSKRNQIVNQKPTHNLSRRVEKDRVQEIPQRQKTPVSVRRVDISPIRQIVNSPRPYIQNNQNPTNLNTKEDQKSQKMGKNLQKAQEKATKPKFENKNFDKKKNFLKSILLENHFQVKLANFWLKFCLIDLI